MNLDPRPEQRSSSASAAARSHERIRKAGRLVLAALTIAAMTAGCGSSKTATSRPTSSPSNGPTSSPSNGPTPTEQVVVPLAGSLGLPIEGGWLHFDYSAQTTTISLEVPEGAVPTVIYQGPALVPAAKGVVMRQIVCQPSSPASKVVILMGATDLDVTTRSDQSNTMAVTGPEGSLALTGDRVFFLSSTAPTQGEAWSVTVGGKPAVSGRVAVWSSVTPAPATNSVCVAVDPAAS